MGRWQPNHQPPPSPHYPNNTTPILSSPVQYRRFPICTPIPKPTPPNSNLTCTARPYYPFPSYTFWPRIDGSGQLLNRNKTKGIRDNTVTATTAKNRVIESIGGASAGYYFRPELFAASLSGEQHPPTPPRPTTGHRGSFCFDCAGNGIRNKDRSRRMMQTSQHEPDNSTRVGEGRSVGRGRALRQSHLVAWERLRRTYPRGSGEKDSGRGGYSRRHQAHLQIEMTVNVVDSLDG